MRYLGVLLGLLCTMSISGREGETTDSMASPPLSIRDAFKQMPTSILPTLSENNRLDMIDFLDSKLKAEVDNLLDGKSEMTALSDDSISIRVSEALHMTLLLLKPSLPTDSLKQIICVAQTYGSDSLSLSTKIDFYTDKWEKLESTPDLFKADKDRISALDLQTIVNWNKEILKKD